MQLAVTASKAANTDALQPDPPSDAFSLDVLASRLRVCGQVDKEWGRRG